MKTIYFYKFILIAILTFQFLYAQHSEIIYLSGTDALNTKEWDFFCSTGRKKGSWQKIAVPSCWEQQGFGAYNYGLMPFAERLKESGIYKHTFDVPAGWKSRTIKIVFEGVMTDADVTINGRSAGAIHQGAFYPFSYDITKLLKYGEQNTLQVLVKKFSDNMSVNYAERKADYWVFGGIFRPVYLQVLPQEHITRVEIDARADGTFNTQVYLSGIDRAETVAVSISDETGATAASFSKELNMAEGKVVISGKVENPALWSPEYPCLYQVTFELKDNQGTILHLISEKAGFRTVDVREQDGIYVNDTRVKLKGVNRHTFHPDYGRTSARAFSIDAVNHIKNMNMNAVRMSHYPPDRHFLDVCDSLGLFVLDELAGWQSPAYDSEVGRKLLLEMVYRDMNHPSIILWDNGNEGGWNTDYDADFRELDIQKREVLHPWSVFEKFNTAHYFDYNYLSMDNFAQRKIFLPTEFLHGLYDGGHAAGLEDYWQKMYNDPLCAGGFLWSFADECIMRTDTKKLDCDGNHAPDGILGPYFEKEGSFFAIRETWAPLFFEKKHITPDFNGVFNIENRFYYTSLQQCRIIYQWIRLPSEKSEEEVLFEGETHTNLAAQNKGQLAVGLFDGWSNSDQLRITAYDPHGRLIHIWSWPVQSPENYYLSHVTSNNEKMLLMEENAESFIFRADSLYVEISKKNGILQRAANAKGTFPIKGGPFLADRDLLCEKVEVFKKNDTYLVKAFYQENGLNIQWTIHGNGLIDLDAQYLPAKDKNEYNGISFYYAENEIKSIRYTGNGPYRVWKNRMTGTQFGVWDKPYNNTITGYCCYQYPEFKGFYSLFYMAGFQNKTKPGFRIYCKTEDIFLRLFTPENPPQPLKTRVEFPPGDISFMHGIMPIGTKFKNADVLGPQSGPLHYLPRRLENENLSISLTFDFSGE